MLDDAGGLPDARLLAMLDDDRQGWVLARSVREDGRIVDFELMYINDAGCRFVGRPREELVGGRYRQLWPETVHDGTLSLYVAVAETGQPLSRTVYYDLPTLRGHFELRISPFGDGFGVRFVDLRQVTVAPQSGGGTRLYDALDAAFDGFTLLRAVTDDTGAIVDFVCDYVNQLGAQLAGRAAEAVIGRKLSDISPGSWDSGLFDRYRSVAETGGTIREQRAFPRAGQVWEIKIARAGAGTPAVAVSFREVTDQVEQERHLAAVAEKAEEAAARATEAAARATALQTATTALVAASTTAEVYAAIGAVLRPSAGGQGLALLLLHEHRLYLRYHDGYEPDVVERLRELPLDHPYPATAVARTGHPLYLTSLAQFRAAQPDPATAVPAGERQAWAFLPLTVAGEVLGSLVVGYRNPREFDYDEQATLMALAGLGAQALQRALLFEARTSLASALQRALLPATLPQVPGLRHAARYLPWTHGADVGGDWYDIIDLGDGVVGVVIGDVAGHNATAAATMGQVRNALRAYATERHNPASVVHHVNQLLLDMHPDTIATCCYLQLHPAEGTMTAVTAGHPPPMLRTADGAGPLRLRTGPPLGVTPDAVYLDTTLLIPPAATLLLYTDGLVEDRRHPIDRGLRELVEALSAAPTRDPGGTLEHVLGSDVGPRPRSDDVALLCLTSDTPPAGEPVARRRFRGEAISASAARRFAADMLTAWGQRQVVDDALLLLDEVITNAIQHTVGDVTVELRLGELLRVTVHDASTRPPQPRDPDADTDNGRGLFIIERLAAAWGSEPVPTGGKLVWFDLPLA
ncbi:SpoIIE family protein phosphatase [Dactylosporangium aurantiacum]|uniref:protein-serine/threonine phosphatase n=1 Tax=Dactylosporangium aurantiacum TaxID=35754 RepID=A0A9Q9IDI2_9ACTN|nr:SpoIIE family protein phosphatase [Dactylosporangium aurantiacum]MDG6107143.1 SpoIIE family protein phosphatase [Dactylosporangium aurantiacum]UWZ51439.1 SpoIIE family protein phosphatase [Dactylosporangium aurantiacum]